MKTETREQVAEIVALARKLQDAHERRSPTAERATLGELDALFNLRWALRNLETENERSSSMSAFLSEDRTFRYSLTRDVAPLTGDGTVTFIGCNPSTADETQDDPTIRRCIDFARRWGFARLKMLNLYAFRSMDPRGLAEHLDPVGPENDCTIAKVVGGSDLVIAAWGAIHTPDRECRVRDVLELIAAPHCLGLTANGSPRHPLYVPAVTLPQPFGDLHPSAVWRRA